MRSAVGIRAWWRNAGRDKDWEGRNRINVELALLGGLLQLKERRRRRGGGSRGQEIRLFSTQCTTKEQVWMCGNKNCGGEAIKMMVLYGHGEKCVNKRYEGLNFFFYIFRWCYSPTHIVRSDKGLSFLIIIQCLFAISLLLSCLCWCTATFVGALPPTIVDQEMASEQRHGMFCGFCLIKGSFAWLESNNLVCSPPSHAPQCSPGGCKLGLYAVRCTLGAELFCCR